MSRIEEINERLSAMLTELETADGDVLTALEAEQRSLTEERDGLLKDIQVRTELRSKIAAGVIPAKEIEKETKTMTDERTFGIDSAEYRSAWLKSLMGAPLNDDEKRAYASSDSNTAIPTKVADTFFAALKKLAPMMSEITLLRAAGNIKVVAQGTVNAASKHTENNAVTASADTILTVTLGAVEFMKVIGISEAASTMSVDAFEDWLVEMLSQDIARKIDDYIINDSSNGIVGITYTTNTNQILNTQTYTYKNIVDLIALLPAGADAEAKFLINKKTLWSDIANITNTAGDPIFVPDTREGFTGRIMGYPVLVDDYVSTSNKSVYLGRFKDIVGNLSKGIEVKRDASSGFLSATINYRGYAAFDSKPARTDNIVRLVSTV